MRIPGYMYIFNPTSSITSLFGFATFLSSNVFGRPLSFPAPLKTKTRKNNIATVSTQLVLEVTIEKKMKVSAAAVILSCSTASAFNVGYLNQLGGNSAPAKLAPEPKAVVTGGPASYLDNLGAGTPELVNAIAEAPVVESVSAPNTGSYLSALNGGSSAPSGGGMTGYLDALPSGAAAISGSGVTSYLDTVGGAAPAAPAPAAPAPVAAAPAAPAAPAATSAPVVAAPAAGDYLSTLGGTGASPISGAGMVGYLDAIPAAAAPTSGAGMANYLDILATGASQTSGAGLAGYLDALATNSVAGSSSVAAPTSPSVSSFLESVYQQILALPEDGSKKVSGSTLTFASANGPFAMSFVKN